MFLSRCRSLSCSVVAIVRSHHLNPQSRKKQKRNTGIRGNRSLGAWVRCRKKSAVLINYYLSLSLLPASPVHLSPTHISDFAFFTWLFISRSGIVLSSSFLPPSQWAFGRLVCDISAPRVHHSSSSSRATALLSPFFLLEKKQKEKHKKPTAFYWPSTSDEKGKKNHNNNNYINT